MAGLCIHPCRLALSMHLLLSHLSSSKVTHVRSPFLRDMQEVAVVTTLSQLRGRAFALAMGDTGHQRVMSSEWRLPWAFIIEALAISLLEGARWEGVLMPLGLFPTAIPMSEPV